RTRSSEGASWICGKPFCSGNARSDRACTVTYYHWVALLGCGGCPLLKYKIEWRLDAQATRWGDVEVDRDMLGDSHPICIFKGDIHSSRVETRRHILILYGDSYCELTSSSEGLPLAYAEPIATIGMCRDRTPASAGDRHGLRGWVLPTLSSIKG